VVRGVEGAVQLAAVGERACAVTRAGRAWCWGSSLDANFYDSWPRHPEAPAQVKGIDGVAEIVMGEGTRSGRIGKRYAFQVWGGYHHCARKRDGTVWCWGNNLFGQLGDGTNKHRRTPAPVRGLEGAVQIASADAVTCATMEDGTVRCWGANREAILGRASAERCAWNDQSGDSFEDDCSTTPVTIPGVEGTVEVAIGGNNNQGVAHACARTRDGRVLCWGNDHCGQLGSGTVTPVPSSWTEPVHAVHEVAGLDRVVQISLGPHLSCALRDDGDVLCWGCESGLDVPSWYQKAGDSAPQRPAPTRAVGVTRAVEIEATYEHVCALRDDGEIVCWGKIMGGRIGDGKAPLPLAAMPRVLDGTSLDLDR
jgi:alpha-tubulin suppressor-like RCC1 family protein